MPRCKNCKDKFTPRKFNWKYCDNEACTDVGVKELLKKQREKQAKDREQVDKAVKAKKERESLATLRNNVKNICHQYIRLRDKCKPCVSCGGEWTEEHQAGHWFKAELYSSIRYDERNIHNQCKKCNLFLNGNVERYTERVHLRIGKAGKAAIQKAAAKYKQDAFKWERSRLVAIRKYNLPLVSC